MADPASLLPGLPDEVAIWDILVRLPPKALLRCRAVSPAWRDATSTPGFLLSHHARQPALPLLYSCSDEDDGPVSMDIGTFDPRAADLFRSVAQLQAPPSRRFAPELWFAHTSSNLTPAASRDGLLLLSIDLEELCICNPAISLDTVRSEPAFGPAAGGPDRTGPSCPAVCIFKTGSKVSRLGQSF